MSSLNHDELMLSCEAIDWDLWLQNDHAASFEENYFLPDFDSPIWHTGINESPGSSQLEYGSQDPSTMNEVEVCGLASNIDYLETSWASFDRQVIPSLEDTEFDISKQNTPPEVNPSSTRVCSSSNQRVPAPTTASPESLTCDWPSCTRTLPTKSAYNQHYKNHTRPFKCPTCGALRATKRHLVRHINERHHAAEKYYCPVHGCTRSMKHFPRRDNLRRHMRQVHCLVNGEKGICVL